MVSRWRLLLPVVGAIDPQLRAAAGTLGASPTRAWREIDLRVATRPLLIGASFALAISLGEFGATSFLTRQGRATLPIAIEQLMEPDRRERGHFISLVYRCRLLGPPEPGLRYEPGKPPSRDQWAWHVDCPPDLIAVQDFYRRFF